MSEERTVKVEAEVEVKAEPDGSRPEGATGVGSEAGDGVHHQDTKAPRGQGTEAGTDECRSEKLEARAQSGYAEVVPGSFRAWTRFATWAWWRSKAKAVKRLPGRVVDRVMIWFIRRSGIAAKFAEIEAHQALLAAGMVRLTERLQRVERRLGMEKGGRVIVPR